MSSAKRIALIIPITIAGTVIVFLIAFAYYQRDWLVPWKSLGAPPEKVIRIVSAEDGLWVKTISGQIYQYKDEYWELSEYPKSGADTSWSECDNPSPSFRSPIDKKTVCRYGAPEISVYAYVISSRGTVFAWQENIGEGGWLWAIPLALFCGFPVSFSVAVAITTSKIEANHLDGDQFLYE